MRTSARTKEELEVDAAGRWGIGRVHLGALQPTPQLGQGGAVRVLFHGDLHNLAALRAEIQKAGGTAASDAAGVLAALYHREGLSSVKRLEGAFCAAILDEPQGTVTLVADHLGSYPLYWFHTGSTFAFASELKAVLRAHPRPALDLETVATIASVGFPFGEGTLAQGVRLMASATTVTYNWRNDAVTVSRYADLAGRFAQPSLSRAEYEQRIVGSFSTAMDHAVDGNARYGLSLSGGLDTRVLLAALDKRHIPLSTFTIGERGCADEAIATTLSRMVSSDHQFIELGDQYLGDLVPNMRRMVTLTDGMYISHGFTETLARQAFEASSFTVLLRGHVGELVKTNTAWPLHTDAQINATSSREAFVSYLAGRLDGHYHGRTLAGVFRNAGELFSGGYGVQALNRAIADAPLPPADLCSYLYFHEYTRRVTVPSLEIFRDVVDVRMPFADPVFLDALTRGQRAWRENTEIHRLLIGANGKKFLGVRNTNTGARAGAGPLEEWVFDKMNTILRRLNVYGYRHYHDFDGWMRKAFLESVERVLLAPEALAREHVDAGKTRALVAQAKQGARDHDHVLQLLTNVELWQQENL
ncbi:MAG: hypothetical protein JSU08_16245 [Acidobacteria bacterium]|nr:hypothetical protein [Acidobacteriota bacterium]